MLLKKDNGMSTKLQSNVQRFCKLQVQFKRRERGGGTRRGLKHPVQQCSIAF